MNSMDDKKSTSGEGSKATVQTVIIVAVLLCLLAVVSQIVLGNAVFALYGLAVIIPLATVFLLVKNREKILDEGTESARDMNDE